MAIAAVCILVLAAGPLHGQEPKRHVLKPTPRTVVWGYFDAASKPVLKIKSGETVQVQTLLAGTPEVLQRGLLPAEEIEPALRDIVNAVKDKGPAGHILTGPIFIEGAEPGATLEVRIQKIQISIPYAYNAFSPQRGVLP